MLTPLVLLIYFLAFFKLHDRKEKANIHMDGLSLVLSTIGFGGVLYGFSSAGNEGWQSPVVISTIIIGAFFYGAFYLASAPNRKTHAKFSYLSFTDVCLVISHFDNFVYLDVFCDADIAHLSTKYSRVHPT